MASCNLQNIFIHGGNTLSSSSSSSSIEVIKSQFSPFSSHHHNPLLKARTASILPVLCSVSGQRTRTDRHPQLGFQTVTTTTDWSWLKTLTDTGKYGRFGGKFVPETLISSLNHLESEFYSALVDPEFQRELATALKEYVGRETPLYYAKRLSDYHKKKNKNGVGADIYLKREDLSHGGAHKMNNAIAQAMLEKRLGLHHVVAATGAGQHGVATAAACAKLSLECTVLMAGRDMESRRLMTC